MKSFVTEDKEISVDNGLWEMSSVLNWKKRERSLKKRDFNWKEKTVMCSPKTSGALKGT